ncbi:hypothetical protein P9112_004539 [Eukaryota sp. TZLM1-RC]
MTATMVNDTFEAQLLSFRRDLEKIRSIYSPTSTSTTPTTPSYTESKPVPNRKPPKPVQKYQPSAQHTSTFQHSSIPFPTDNSYARSQMSSLKSDLRLAQDEINSLKSKLSQAEQANDHLQQCLVTAHDQLANLNQELISNNKTHLIDQLQSKLSAEMFENSRLSDRISVLEQRLLSREKEKIRESVSIPFVNSHSGVTQQQHDSLKQQYSSLESLYNKSKTDNTELLAKLSMLNSEISRVCADNAKLASLLEESQRGTFESISYLKGKLEEKEGEVCSLNGKISDLMDEITEKSKYISELSQLLTDNQSGVLQAVGGLVSINDVANPSNDVSIQTDDVVIEDFELFINPLRSL